VQDRQLHVVVDFELDDERVVSETFRSVEPNDDWFENNVREWVRRHDKIEARLTEIPEGEYVLPDRG
jgi:hypothetical protein